MRIVEALVIGILAMTMSWTVMDSALKVIELEDRNCMNEKLLHENKFVYESFARLSAGIELNEKDFDEYRWNMKVQEWKKECEALCGVMILDVERKEDSVELTWQCGEKKYRAEFNQRSMNEK